MDIILNDCIKIKTFWQLELWWVRRQWPPRQGGVPAGCAQPSLRGAVVGSPVLRIWIL